MFTGSSYLELPVRPRSADDGRLRPFEEPESAPRPSYTELEPARSQRTVDRNAATGDVVCTIVSEGGGFGAEGRGRLEALGLEIGHTMVRCYRSRADDPLAARVEVTQEMTLARGGWTVKVATQLSLAATRTTFQLEGTLEAFEGGARVVARRWVRSVPRSGV